MQSGEVAERAGLSVRTIRFYEESGLVSASARRQGLKPLDFSLEELRVLLALLEDVADRSGSDGVHSEVLERLSPHRQLADRRVTTLHAQWSSGAAFATHLRQQEERLRFAREIRS